MPMRIRSARFYLKRVQTKEKPQNNRVMLACRFFGSRKNYKLLQNGLGLWWRVVEASLFTG